MRVSEPEEDRAKVGPPAGYVSAPAASEILGARTSPSAAPDLAVDSAVTAYEFQASGRKGYNSSR